ncbi:MAG: hypothetical protein STSR0006_15960 [Lentimicrobium sp.]
MKNKLNIIIENSLKFGALMGVVFILLSLIYYIAGFDQFNAVFGIVNLLVSLAVYIGFLYYSNKTLRDKKLNKVLTYTDGLLNSFITGIIAAILSGIYSYLFYQYFDPAYFAESIERSIEMLEQNPTLTGEVLDNAIAKIESITPLNSALQGFYGNIAMSFIFALIISAFTRKKPLPSFSDEEISTND